MDQTLIVKKIVAKYILGAMMSWVPLTSHYERDPAGYFLHNEHGYFVQENQADVLARYEKTAEQIVDVAYDDANPPMFLGDDGRLKTALELASVASFEGGFNKWVDDGTCNTKPFQDRAKQQNRMECDGGSAWSIWQIHLYNFVIKDGTLVQARFLVQSAKQEDRDWIAAHSSDVITGAQLVANRKLAAWIAYALMRGSFHNHRNLCEYTGESCTGSHPLATQRFERAVNYKTAHPFTLPTEDQLEAMAHQEELATNGQTN